MRVLRMKRIGCLISSDQLGVEILALPLQANLDILGSVNNMIVRYDITMLEMLEMLERCKVL
jgi:hypothetical protein